MSSQVSQRNSRSNSPKISSMPPIEPITSSIPMPRVRLGTQARPLPPKTTAAAICFFSLGIIFLSWGLVLYFTTSYSSSDRGVTLIVLGSLFFLPGVYATTIILGAYLGWEGYDYQMLPSYDED